MFDGRWALITGAGSGIGRALAERLANEGARLVILDNDEERLRVAADELGVKTEVLPFLVDVGDRAQVLACAERVNARLGAVDLLVNNAGVLETGGFDDSSWDAWERVVRVNLWGVIHGVKAFAPAMRARRRGAILNVASASGLLGFSPLTAYSTSKFAVVGFSAAVGAELAPEGITVTCLCPGLVNTSIDRSVSEEGRAGVRGSLDRHGVSPDKVARAALEGVRRGKPLVTPDAQAVALSWAVRLFPGSSARWVHRLVTGKRG